MALYPLLNSYPQQAFGPSSSPNVHAFSFSFQHAMLHPHVHLCASIIHTLQAVICRRESASRFYVTSANLPPTPSIFLKNSVMPFFFRAEWYSVLYTCQVFTVHSPGRILTNPPSGISRVLELQVCTTMSRSVFSFQSTVQLTVVWTGRFCIKNNFWRDGEVASRR